MNKLALPVFFLAQVVCFLSSSAVAGVVTVLGARSCAEWNDHLAEKRQVTGGVSFSWVGRSQDESWLMGLMSGLNTDSSYETNYLGAANGHLVIDWIDIYCKENPNKTVFEGAQDLMVKLIKKDRSDQKSTRKNP